MNTNYLTSPLTSYDPALQARAAELFSLIADRVGRSRGRIEKGSYSILGKSNNGVAAKIIIHEGRRGPRLLEDGVYVLTLPEDDTVEPTMAIGPWWNTRYRYFRIAAPSLAETAILVAAYSDGYEDDYMRKFDGDSQNNNETPTQVPDPLDQPASMLRTTLVGFVRRVVRVCNRVQEVAATALWQVLGGLWNADDRDENAQRRLRARGVALIRDRRVEE